MANEQVKKFLEMIEKNSTDSKAPVRLGRSFVGLHGMAQLQSIRKHSLHTGRNR